MNGSNASAYKKVFIPVLVFFSIYIWVLKTRVRLNKNYLVAPVVL